MSRRAQARFNEAPASAAQVLFGQLGGAAAVPFYYNRLYNLNRDNAGNIVQWADCIRGYGGSGTPPVLTPALLTGGTVTYDAVKGVVAAAVLGTALVGAFSSAFSLSAGPMGGPVTTQAIGTIWCVGEIDAGSDTAGILATTVSSVGNFGIAIQADPGTGDYGTTNEQGAAFSAVSAVSVDGTRRLLILTNQTGQQHGIQVPNDALVQHTGEIARAVTSYELGLLASSLAPGCSGSIAEIGGLFRTATASDVALLAANATSVHAATLH